MNSPDRPERVTLASRLLLASLGIGLFLLLLTPGQPLRLAGGVLTLAVIAWLALRIRAGSNRARIAYLALAIVGLPAYFGFLAAEPRTAGAGWIGGANSLLHAAAIFLLLTGDSPSWFRRGAERKKRA